MKAMKTKCWHCRSNMPSWGPHSPYCSDTCQQRNCALQGAVADAFGDDERGINRPLSPEGRTAVKAKVPWATDAQIDAVYRFRVWYEMNIAECEADDAANKAWGGREN